MRIAILEDNPLNAEVLQNYLIQFAQEEHVSINYTHFSNGQEFLNQVHTNWDLILLDIEMPFINGMEVAKEIRKFDSNVLIIFITQLTQYAIEGYSVQALDYILKPINYYALAMKLKQVMQILISRQSQFLIVSNQHGKIKLNLDQLRYVEVYDHTLSYHTLSDTFTSTSFRSLNKLAEVINSTNFSRCHQGYLVNLQYVTSYNKSFVFLDSDQLPISRTYYKPFLESLLTYWRNSMP